MTYAIGNPITWVITLRNPDDGTPILGQEEIDFEIIEAYLATNMMTTAIVDIEELDGGQYTLTFTPSTFGTWALHYFYSDLPLILEDTKEYVIESTATINVTTSGGPWTYTGDLTDPSQEVRFLIQDTDGSFPLFTDNEVAFALGASSSSTRRAAVFLVQRLMARYAAMADTTELDLSVRASQLYANAEKLLMSLNNGFLGSGSVTPYAGGISKSDGLSNRSNRDRVPGVFDRNPFDPSDWGGIRH